MKTEKIYYKNQFQTSCEAVLIASTENGLIFNKTVAYPEGGGQIGDVGILIRCKDGSEIPFYNTTKIKGRNLFLNDFPSIKVENQIVHHVDNNYEFEKDEKFLIKLDSVKRSQITLHHSALHLALMVLEEMISGIDKKIIGAKITDKYGRLDFAIDFKFSSEQIAQIECRCNEYIDKNILINAFSHPEENEALYWKCDNYIIPCGGTHCENAKYLVGIKIKRKSIGKTSERLIVELPFNEEFLKLYGDSND
ncbi:alanine--tRNA ligase-related protein [Cetobacterium sp.]|uniref:alanine--tRNA ligase-related protein n=1 Tax=Cetobacterium sp. TaxID=2071632 RepID=UPI0025C6CABF|nr:alanine--tRNA ligase-related protein [Cetobacterium sp.]